MEENKEIMAEQPKKFTYEQLENIANSLSNQVQQLSARLQEANMMNIFKRLDYCFKVLECSASFNTEFVNKCSEEIIEIMTPSEEIKED